MESPLSTGVPALSLGLVPISFKGRNHILCSGGLQSGVHADLLPKEHAGSFKEINFQILKFCIF